MTSFTPVDVIDFKSPLTIRERNTIEGPSTASEDLVVRGRARSGYTVREWEIDIPASNVMAHLRAISLHATSAYGVLPLRWTPPNETEIDVFMDVENGLDTARVRPRSWNLRLNLRQVK